VQFPLGLLILWVVCWPAAALADAGAATPLGFISVVPPLVAIAAALIFRQVVPALFLGVWFGAAALHGASVLSIWTGLLDVVQVYVVNAMADRGHAAIIIFSLMIGGMVGIISRAGGMLGVVTHIVRFATDHRRAQLGAVGLGLAIFFDDYTNTLVVGNTMRPVTDRLRVSREKLAYIVDSTAAPVACLAVITTWIGYEVGLIDSAIAGIRGLHEPYLLFLSSLRYSYYPILAIIFVIMVAASGRDFGPMHAAERRARRRGAADLDASDVPVGHMSEVDPKPGVEGHVAVAVVPVGVLIAGVVGGLVATGHGASIREIIGSADAYKALVWGSLLGVMTAGGMALGRRTLDLTEALEAWLAGMKAMFVAFIVLILAWALASVTESLGTAKYLVSLLGGTVPAGLLPSLVFLLAAATAFATGTSWGVMGILMPLVVPLAWAIVGGGAGTAGPHSQTILQGCIASVLAGAVWGDHCSPISDTTILSSLASGCDHVAHVRTQMPYALVVGAVAVLGGSLPAGYGMPWWLGLVIGAAALWAALLAFGRRA
jgi:Na+/H+ antiporter NhaC